MLCVGRLTWAAVMVTAMGLFLSLMATKIKEYYSFPKIVNVEVTYNDSLDFPAVTICNTNTFKSVTIYNAFDTFGWQHGNISKSMACMNKSSEKNGKSNAHC